MRQILAAIGVFALAGSASAQYPSPAAVAGTPIAPGHGAVFVDNASKHPVAGGYFTSKAAFGDRFQNNASGSFHSDFAFAMGSSRSFFSPCGPFIGGPYKSCFRKPAANSPPCDYSTYSNK